MDGVTVRPETPADFDAVREVLDLAFHDSPDSESALVDALRAQSDYTPELSLVAELDGAIVGHIIFTDARIETESA